MALTENFVTSGNEMMCLDVKDATVKREYCNIVGWNNYLGTDVHGSNIFTKNY